MKLVTKQNKGSLRSKQARQLRRQRLDALFLATERWQLISHCRKLNTEMLYHNWCLKKNFVIFYFITTMNPMDWLFVKTSSYSSILSPQWIQWIGCFEKLHHILFHHHNESNGLGVCKNFIIFFYFVATMNPMNWVFWKTSSYSISSPSQWIPWIGCL